MMCVSRDGPHVTAPATPCTEPRPDRLLESGPVAYESGVPRDAPLSEQLESLTSIYGESASVLERLGARLISVNPPMWVVDGHAGAEQFVQFAEAELGRAAPSAWETIPHPGSYVRQERLPLPKLEDTDARAPRAELAPLNQLLKQITATDSTFLDDERSCKTVAVKRYGAHCDAAAQPSEPSGQPSGRAAGLAAGRPAGHPLGRSLGGGGGITQLSMLERLHIDRNREAGCYALTG